MSAQVSPKDPSLCPPPHGYNPYGNEDPPPSWVLLDLHAYVADRENATSAYSEMSNGAVIRVTFCTAPPPLVSYICIWCPNLPPTKLEMEPTIKAAEADLVLFRVSLSGHRTRHDHFVYKAPSGGKGPFLWRLEKPDLFLPCRNSIALLAHREVGEAGHFYIASLNDDLDWPGNLNLLLYNSVDKKWSSSPVNTSMLGIHRTVNTIHNTAKTITLGEGGLLGFVDPWKGILVCDTLARKREHYLRLPQVLIRRDKLQGEPMLHRDIALVNGRLTLVELHRSASNHDSSPKCWSWYVSTWSISSPWEGQDGWQMDYRINISSIIVDDATANVDLLCKLQDNRVVPQAALDKLHFAHPTLSLSESHIVYLMAKVGLLDKKALVLAVDMRKPWLQGVAVFDAERMMGYTYRQSRISSFFNMLPGLKGSLKRPGKFHTRYPHKHRNVNDNGPVQLSGTIADDEGTNMSVD